MFASTENIGVDKMLSWTQYSRRQNVGVDKIFASTKYWRRQNTRVDKILASTKYSCQQNSRIEKCWRRHGSISLLFGSAESTVADFSQTLLMISYVSQKVLILPHAVTKCAVATGRPAFMGRLSPALYRLIVPARHAENITNIGINKILVPPRFH